MRQFKSNDEFYTHLDKLTEALYEQELSESADKLHALLHKAIWTTSTELFGELRLCFYEILRSDKERLDTSLREDIEQCAVLLEQALSR